MFYGADYDKTAFSVNGARINADRVCADCRVFFNRVGEMMISGIEQVAPIAVMIMFAILYFGIMIDTGLFDPMVSRILKLVKGDPLKIVVGTAVLTMLVALDGDGSTTYMITTSAMLPLYIMLGIRPIILAESPGSAWVS